MTYEESGTEIGYTDLATVLGDLVQEKNDAYGDSAGTAHKFLELLYPDGVPIEKYNDMLIIVRVIDKLKRIATDKDALGETPWQDIAGYGLIGMMQKLKEEAGRDKNKK